MSRTPGAGVITSRSHPRFLGHKGSLDTHGEFNPLATAVDRE
jgi:hypothetical protein